MTPDIHKLKELALAAKENVKGPEADIIWDRFAEAAANPDTILALIEVVEAAQDMWRLTLLIETGVRQMEGVDSVNYKKTLAAIKRLRTALEGVKE